MKFKEFLGTKGLDVADFEGKTVAEKGALMAEFNDINVKRIEELEESNKSIVKLEDALKKQGEVITEMKNTSSKKTKTPYETFKEDVDSNLSKLKEIKENKTGVVSFSVKAAGITGTVAISPGTASLTNGQSASSSLYEGGETVYTLQRVKPSVIDFASVTTTTQDHINYRNEVVAEGDFAVTAEGAIKPLRQYKFAKASSDAQKVAGHTIVTDEFERDYPRLWSLIQTLMREDCNDEMGRIVMADMVNKAAPYTLNSLDDLIVNADNYAAIGAVVCQLQSLGYNPNVLALNPADAWAMRLTKDSTGQYIIPPFLVNGNNYEFGTLYVDPTVPAGNFFLGDASQYKVELVGEIKVRMGYINDHLIRNEMTLVVERYFHNYIPDARRAGFVYANFATVKADIEKP